MAKKGSSRKGTNKTFAAKRTMNPPNTSGRRGVNNTTTGAFQQHDALRRMGSFEGTGEHARTGNRGHQ